MTHGKRLRARRLPYKATPYRVVDGLKWQVKVRIWGQREERIPKN